MYAKNLTAFLLHVVNDGKLRLDPQDEIIRDTLLTDGGEIVNKRLRELYSLPALAAPVAAALEGNKS
jgi:NAD(P) transhydrogenase subunit alpha